MKAKRVTALILAAMLLGGMTALAEGGEAPAPEELFLLGEASSTGDVAVQEAVTASEPKPASEPQPDPEGEFFSSDSVDMFLEAQEPAMAAVTTSAPTAYDPRGMGYLTPVRNQGAWNTCWAMAAIAAAELQGLKSGLLTTNSAAADLSERHLIYFFAHGAADPLGNSTGDNNINPSFWMRTGGNPVIATMTLASWHGAADETATNSPYSGLTTADSLDAAYAYADELHLENTYVLDISTADGRSALQDSIRTYGGAVLCLYMSPGYLFAGSPSAQTVEPSAPTEPTVDPDPVDPDAPMEDPITDAELSPEETPVPETEELSPEEDASDEAEDAVLLDGAAWTEALSADGDGEDFTVCYYQNTTRTTNHEVVVVGWDDAYPAENFGYSEAGAVPPGNGAWLCRNSQGDAWSGGDGYFWVSYYDASAAARTGGAISGRVTVFDFASKDNFDHNYEYDGAAVLGYVNDAVDGRGISTLDADGDTLRWYANVFTASGNASARGTESLRAVSTYTYRPGVSYTAQVYTGVDADDPASGTLAAEVSGTFEYAGYHTVPLPESVPLAEGERFAVVFRIGRASDDSLFVPSCATSSNWYAANESEAGQSFVSLDGDRWLDCYDLKNEPNVRIKAFTDDVEAVFPFTDVKSGAWYYDDVRSAWLAYLVEGKTATTYDPAAEASRAQVVTVLWRLAGSPTPENASAYTDVKSGTWYADAVAWAGENGVVTGYTDGSFRPSRTVTRQEFMTILYRYAAATGMDVSAAADLTAFSDSGSVGSWAKTAMAWSVGSGLQKGVASSTGVVSLSPEGSVTRAQLAAFLNRFAAMLS